MNNGKTEKKILGILGRHKDLKEKDIRNMIGNKSTINPSLRNLLKKGKVLRRKEKNYFLWNLSDNERKYNQENSRIIDFRETSFKNINKEVESSIRELEAIKFSEKEAERIIDLFGREWFKELINDDLYSFRSSSGKSTLNITVAGQEGQFQIILTEDIETKEHTAEIYAYGEYQKDRLKEIGDWIEYDDYQSYSAGIQEAEEIIKELEDYTKAMYILKDVMKDPKAKQAKFNRKSGYQFEY